jgi:hypothetical protein
VSAGRRRRVKVVEAEQRYVDSIQRVVACAPPLSAEQKARLALLLNGGAAA